MVVSQATGIGGGGLRLTRGIHIWRRLVDSSAVGYILSSGKCSLNHSMSWAVKGCMASIGRLE